MNIGDKVKENLAYSKELLDAGIDGANTARKEVLQADKAPELVTLAIRESWQPTTIGLLAGALCGVLADDRKPACGAVAGGLLGAVLGFACSFAWKTRPLTSAMASQAGQRINQVRDKHWLTKHPVAYG
jgi:hypothetical protein